MTKKKKIILISLLVIAVIVLIFTGYHVIRHISAGSRMEKLSADLERRMGEWEKKEYKRAPLFGETVPGNAAEFYREAEKKLEQAGVKFGFEEARNNPDKPLSSELHAYYDRNKHTAELVEKGACAATYRSLINIRGGIEEELPGLIETQNIARIMILKGRELLADNKDSEALKLYYCILRMGNDRIQEGPLLVSMIGGAIYSMGRQEIQRLLLENKFSSEHITELIRYLNILRQETSMGNCWDTEQYMVENTLKRLSEEAGLLPDTGLGEIITPPSFEEKKKGLKVWFEDMWSYGANRADYVDTWEKVVLLYPIKKKLNASFDLNESAEKEVKELNDETEKIKGTISGLFIIDLTSLVDYFSYLREKTFLDGVYILAALKLYYAQHGKYPAVLNELSPDIIPQVPLDSFSRKPFIYRLDDKGALWLYSVGWDFKDSFGDEYPDDLIVSPTLME